MRLRPRFDSSTALTLFGLVGVLLVAGLAAAAGWFAMFGRDVGLPPAHAIRRPAVTSSAQAPPMVPVPGQTGAAGCVDPAAGQEWRVTWRAVTGWSSLPPAPADVTVTAGSAPTTAAGPATAAAPTALTAPTTVAGPPTAAGPSPAAVPTETATGAGVDGIGAGVPDPVTELLPTGFAVRTLTASGSAAETAPPGGAATGTSREPDDNGGWRSEDAARWRVRWTPTPAERLAAAPGETFQRDGALLDLAGLTLPVTDSPRYLSPDGACTLYPAPFVSAPSAGDARPGAAADGGDGDPVAVIGDDPVAQLTPADEPPATTDDLLQSRLWQAGRPSEIAAVPGGRWSRPPDPPEVSMLDELRGLRQAGTTVIALGTGDADWAAAVPGSAYRQRSAWVLSQLSQLLDEVSDDGRCTVLVTVAHRGDYRPGTAIGRFDTVAGLINSALRLRANASPNDHLKLADWAVLAGRNRSTGGRPWFQAGSAVAPATGGTQPHQALNAAGRQEYANALTRAATLC